MKTKKGNLNLKALKRRKSLLQFHSSSTLADQLSEWNNQSERTSSTRPVTLRESMKMTQIVTIPQSQTMLMMNLHPSNSTKTDRRTRQKRAACNLRASLHTMITCQVILSSSIRPKTGSNSKACGLKLKLKDNSKSSRTNTWILLSHIIFWLKVNPRISWNKRLLGSLLKRNKSKKILIREFWATITRTLFKETVCVKTTLLKSKRSMHLSFTLSTKTTKNR